MWKQDFWYFVLLPLIGFWCLFWCCVTVRLFSERWLRLHPSIPRSRKGCWKIFPFRMRYSIRMEEYSGWMMHSVMWQERIPGIGKIFQTCFRRLMRLHFRAKRKKQMCRFFIMKTIIRHICRSFQWEISTRKYRLWIFRRKGIIWSHCICLTIRSWIITSVRIRNRKWLPDWSTWTITMKCLRAWRR